MNTKAIESLFLNIKDIIEITVENFYYKLTKEDKQTIVEFEQNKKNEKDWIHCPKIIGSYCGDNYSQKSDYKELNIIKIRAASPFKMASSSRHYLTFAPSQITGIAMIKKKKPGVLDKLFHTLTMEKTINEN